MKKLFLLLLIGSIATIFSPDCSAATRGCYDIEVIYARGSGASMDGSSEYDALLAATEKMGDKYGISAHLRDLDYPAIGLTAPSKILGAYVSAGKAYSFGKSVRTGVYNLRHLYRDLHTACPETKFIFVGYSQGAMVVSGAASSFDADTTYFLMLIGDPKTYLPEGAGLFPSACFGGTLSSWRTFVPNCRTHEGVFGGRKEYEEPKLKGKYSLWCARNDYICGSSKNPFRNSGHTNYAGSGEIGWGFAYLAKKYDVAKSGLTERPEIRSAKRSESEINVDEIVDDGGGFAVAKPDANVERDGNSLRLRFEAPEGAEYLLIRLNGFDLGYIDASLGEFEIRDVEDNDDLRLELAWLDEDGEMSKLASVFEKKDDELIAGDIEKKDEPLPPVAANNAAPSTESSNEKHVSSTTANTLPVPTLNEGVVTRRLTERPLQRTRAPVGLDYAKKSDIVKIILGMIGAGGLLVIFVARRRRGN